MTVIQFCILLVLVISCSITSDSGQVITQERLTENYKVCIIGDSGRNSKEQKLVAEVLAGESCNQVRHLGDIIYPSGIETSDDPKFDTHFYQYYKKMIEAGIPFYMSVGNHDYKENPKAWIHIAESMENIKFPGLYFMDVFFDICFITLDTNSDFLRQIFWYKKINKEYSKICKLNLTFGHHPLYSSGKHGNANLGVRLFLNNTVSGTANAYFSGHEHHLEDIGVRDNTQYFISGAAGSTRRLQETPPRWAISKLGYQILTIHYKHNIPFIKYSFYSIDKNSEQKNLEHSGSIYSRAGTR